MMSPKLMADPAWDMMLDLFVADAEGRRVDVTGLCIAANVPSTTALRWIGALVAAGLFERSRDTYDRRRAYVTLTTAARQMMEDYFALI